MIDIVMENDAELQATESPHERLRILLRTLSKVIDEIEATYQAQGGDDVGKVVAPQSDEAE